MRDLYIYENEEEKQAVSFERLNEKKKHDSKIYFNILIVVHDVVYNTTAVVLACQVYPITS